MSRTLLLFGFALFLGNGMFAEEHNHGKKDTVVIVESPKDNHHHHHCEEIRTFKAACLQWTRPWIRPTLGAIGVGIGYYYGLEKYKSTPNVQVSKALAHATFVGSVGFTIGHVLKNVCKLTMYLNNIPKK